MRRALGLVPALLTLWLMAPSVYAANICVIVADAETGAVLHEEGDCRSRVTPASTFKIALAAMGFDAGTITTHDAPVLTIAPGEPTYGGPAWQAPVDPRAWLEHSVVWYSQRIAKALGHDVLENYGRQFGYGNADFSGDPGQDNGLERAWIASSLAISPLEQIAFLRNLLTSRLPISASARANTLAIVETFQPAAGWSIAGKTGSAYPRTSDGGFDYARGWGWFVGWAEHGDTRLVFARLDRDETRHEVSGGLRARDGLIAQWPAVIAALRL